MRETPARSLEDTIPAIALDIARLEPGPAASLRRTPQAGAGTAALWRLLARHNPIGADRNTNGWASVVQGIAILTPTGRNPDKLSAHEPTMALGRALAESRVSEGVLTRMLASRGRRRRDAAVRACRRLAKGRRNRFDAVTLARFVIHEDEATDRRIARDYYRTERRLQAAAEETKENDTA